MRRTLAVVMLGLGLWITRADIALARIKLITLPVRERVEIQLDNPNATLVEEERIVPLVKGINQVDFSWANTQIDPSTILFRVIPRVEEAQPETGPAAKEAESGQATKEAEPLDVKVLSVSYPPNEAALVWQVSSSGSGPARVRISYLLGNLTKSFNYRAVAAHDESVLTLSQYIRLENFANEEFGSTGLWAGFGPRFLKPIGINETKQMLMEKFEKKDKAVTLDVSESVRGIRNEVAGDTGRDVQWQLGPETTFEGGPDQEKSTFDQIVFHMPLPARGADAKATKIVHKLHLILKNEW